MRDMARHFFRVNSPRSRDFAAVPFFEAPCFSAPLSFVARVVNAAAMTDVDACERPLREVAHTLLSRLVMVAAELDCGDELEEVERLLREGGGAARQRAEHARSGMDGLVSSLVERTRPAASSPC